jgi:protoheme IX farnesyltransferase
LTFNLRHDTYAILEHIDCVVVRAQEFGRTERHTAYFMSTTTPIAVPSNPILSLLRDYAELTKLRVTTLIVMTAWCGYFFGAHKVSISWLSWGLFHSLAGIGLVSSGTAALNEVMEHDVDARMRRTSMRPLPAQRMSLLHATIVGAAATIGGSVYLAIFTNPLTGLLTLLTSVVYLAAYTPLKKISPICTFVGAFPGAMPGVLGWTAACGRLEWGSLVLFAILFIWQFPHFFSIAWLYREDYAKGGIRMLPVVEEDGRSTARRILIYSLALLAVSVLPSFFGMAGTVYLGGAILLGLGLLYFGVRLAFLNLPPGSALSKMRARQVLQATVIYLPLLFALMMGNCLRP